AGDYAAATDARSLADLLTSDLRAASGDSHLEVIYSQQTLPAGPPPQPTPESDARYKADMQRQNCTFEKVELRPHGIGYLKLNFFPQRAACEAIATAAMSSLNTAQALIIDLRDNRGGFADLVMLMASYLF